MGNAHDLDAAPLLVDHNTCTIAWDGLRLSSMVDAEAPHYKRDYWRKIVYFRSRPAMRLIADAKYNVRAPQLGLRGTSRRPGVSDRRTSAS